MDVSGNLNGAVSSNIVSCLLPSFLGCPTNATLNKHQYRAKDKPRYTLGHGLALLYIAIAWLATLLFMYLLRRENAQRDQGKRDEDIVGNSEDQIVGDVSEKDVTRNGTFASLADAKREKGDEWSGYRYTL